MSLYKSNHLPSETVISNKVIYFQQQNNIYLWTHKLFTDSYDAHHEAFRVLQSEERCIIKMSETKFYKPFDIQSSYSVADEKQYIISSFVMI